MTVIVIVVLVALAAAAGRLRRRRTDMFRLSGAQLDRVRRNQALRSASVQHQTREGSR